MITIKILKEKKKKKGKNKITGINSYYSDLYT